MTAFLTNFSVSTADSLVDEWVQFFPELFVKYRDGLTVQLPAPPKAHPNDQPPPPLCRGKGFPQSWYDRIVNDGATAAQYL